MSSICFIQQITKQNLKNYIPHTRLEFRKRNLENDLQAETRVECEKSNLLNLSL